MKEFLSIIVGTVVFVLVMMGYLLLQRDETDEAEELGLGGEKPIWPSIFCGVVTGTVVGLIDYFVPRFTGGLAFLAPISLAVMLLLSVTLIVAWVRWGADLKELVIFLSLGVLLFLVTSATAVMTGALLAGVAKSLVLALPVLMAIAAAGIILYNFFKFRYTRLGGNEMYHAGSYASAIGAIILAIIVLIQAIATPLAQAPARAAETSTESTTTSEAEMTSSVSSEAATVSSEAATVSSEAATVSSEATAVSSEAATVSSEANAAGWTNEQKREFVEYCITWYKYYHYELLKNDSSDNIEDDFNFGPSAYVEGMSAEEALAELFARVTLDPMLGVAIFAAFDVRLGTDFMQPGIHYDQNWSDGYWTTLINEFIGYYAENEDEYVRVAQRWESFVVTYASARLDYVQNIMDQMYAITLTTDSEWEAPEIIIAETLQPDGHVLSLIFYIKGNEFIVPLRLECGFQPTNVAEPMKETPKVNPVVEKYGPKENPNDPNPKKKPGGKDDPEPTIDDPEPTGAPDPTPTPEAKKKPKEDSVNQGDADKGGSQNRDDEVGEEQDKDSRTEHPTGSENDNNHGHSEPQTVTPTTPPVVEEHKSEQVVTDENPQNYEPDPVTDRGPADVTEQPTNPGGDGAFTPQD